MLADSLPFIARALKERLGRPIPAASIVRLHHPENAELAAVFDAHDTELYAAVPPVPGAPEALRLLSRHYHLHLITGRPEHVRRVTERWLQRHGIPFDAADFLTGADKAPLCRAAAVARFVDDSWENGLRIAEGAGIPVAILAAEYNRAGAHPLVTRLPDWQAIIRWAGGTGRAGVTARPGPDVA